MIAIRQARHNPLTWGLLAWFAALGGQAVGQEARSWKAGPAFRRELEKPVTATWSQRALRGAAASLSKTIGVAIFLDRRIDGEQNIELEVREQPLQSLLPKLVAGTDAGAAAIDPVVYLGPKETAAKLATLAAIRRQEAALLPAAAKANLLRLQPWKWEELAEPRALLDELSKQGSITVENAEIIPHDLWPAASLPPLAWVDRLTLLLAGFDLTFEFTAQGRRVRLIAVPETVVLEKTYTPRGLPDAAAAQLRQIVPEAKIRVESGKLAVAGSQEDHEKVERLLAGQSIRTVTPVKDGAGEKRFTLTMDKNSAGAVVRKIATELGKELKFDTAALAKLKQEVSVSVKNVTLDELLTTTLKPLGLKYKITDTAIEIATAD